MKNEINFRKRANAGAEMRESNGLPRRLTDWPPETDYEPIHHADENRKGPALITALLLLGLAVFFYLRM